MKCWTTTLTGPSIGLLLRFHTKDDSDNVYSVLVYYIIHWSRYTLPGEAHKAEPVFVKGRIVAAEGGKDQHFETQGIFCPPYDSH